MLRELGMNVGSGFLEYLVLSVIQFLLYFRVWRSLRGDIGYRYRPRRDLGAEGELDTQDLPRGSLLRGSVHGQQMGWFLRVIGGPPWAMRMV